MRRIRTFAILCGIHSAAFAQIQDLATTANGEQTYFATSYRQKDSAQTGYLKILRIAENGLELVKQLNLSVSFPGADPNFFLAEHPSVSADGRVLGFTAAKTCNGGSHCIALSITQDSWLVPLIGAWARGFLRLALTDVPICCLTTRTLWLMV